MDVVYSVHIYHTRYERNTTSCLTMRVVYHMLVCDISPFITYTRSDAD